MPARRSAYNVGDSGYSLDSKNLVIQRSKVITIDSTPTGAAQDTGWDLPKNCVVESVYVVVTKAEAGGTTKTLDVGLLAGESGGDADGFLDGVDVSSVGIKKGTLASAGQTLGALLRADESGSGALVPEPHVVTTSSARSVVYTAGSNNFTTFRGQIIILYKELGEEVTS